MSRKLSYQEKILQMAKRHKKSAGKHVVIGLIIVTLFIVGFEMFFSPKVDTVWKKAESELTASFVGDMMFGRFVKEVTDKHGTEYLFDHVKPYFDKSDYVVGNFENTIINQEASTYDKPEKSIYLNTDISSLETLKKMNFSLVNLANNHTMDYGEEALTETLAALEKVGLRSVGAGKDLEDATKIDYQEKNGLTIATLGFSDVLPAGTSALGHRGGVAAATPDNMVPAIKEAKENADLVTVQIHWGQEYDNEPHPRQEKLARAMVDAGADIILGHHAHVLQHVEKYKDAVIFYGLGNFIFDQGWSRTKDSALVQYDLLEDGTGRFEVIPLRIRGAQPYVTKNKYYQMKIMKQLTENQPSENFKKDDGKLIIEVDHSAVLEKEGSNRGE